MFCSYCYFFVLSQFVLCNLLVLWLKSPLREAAKRAVMENASVCIDYKKAFDLIDHGQSFYQSLRRIQGTPST